MRTYSHALLTWVLVRRLRSFEPGVAAWGAAGAALPDLPAAAGAARLLVWRKRIFSREEFRGEVCTRGRFGVPDAALHSALPVALALYRVFGAKRHDPWGKSAAFLVGWGGHVLSDALTHADDARPILWPLSGWRMRSPVSYWDRARHARPFTLLEHAVVLVVAVWEIQHGRRR